MKNQMAPNILLVIVLLAAVGAVARRAAARRPELQEVHGAGPAPITVTAGETQSRPAATIGTNDGTGHEKAKPPTTRGRPAITVEQAQHVFHDLHAEGRNTLCAVCDSQYESERPQLST
jgi:hypothetical protein